MCSAGHSLDIRTTAAPAHPKRTTTEVPFTRISEPVIHENVGLAYGGREGRAARSMELIQAIARMVREGRGFYFGFTFGSPPGLPGGGITGLLPLSGAGTLMPGSTLGGQITPRP